MKYFIVVMSLILGLWATPSFAAGSSAEADMRACPVGPRCMVVVNWVADDTDGSVPAETFDLPTPPAGFQWYADIAVVDPGATAPQDNYDIDVDDDTNGAIWGAELDDLDTAVTEYRRPLHQGVYGSVPVYGTVSVDVEQDGTPVNSATGAVYLFFQLKGE